MRIFCIPLCLFPRGRCPKTIQATTQHGESVKQLAKHRQGIVTQPGDHTPYPCSPAPLLDVYFSHMYIFVGSMWVLSVQVQVMLHCQMSGLLASNSLPEQMIHNFLRSSSLGGIFPCGVEVTRGLLPTLPTQEFWDLEICLTVCNITACPVTSCK